MGLERAAQEAVSGERFLIGLQEEFGGSVALFSKALGIDLSTIVSCSNHSPYDRGIEPGVRARGANSTSTATDGPTPSLVREYGQRACDKGQLSRTACTPGLSFSRKIASFLGMCMPARKWSRR